MRRGKYTFPAALFLYGILTLNMTNVILHFVQNDRLFVYRHVERKRTPLGRSPPLWHASRATSPASTGEHTSGRVVFFGVYTKNKKSERKKILRSDFNHIVNLFVNYINLRTKF